MNIMRPLALAALATAIATPALADSRQTIYLTPFIGFQLFDDARDLSETGITGIGVEYRFAPHWALEAVYSKDSADRKYTAGSSEFEDFRLDGTYYFATQEEAWNPYLSIGAGQTDFGDDKIGYQSLGSDHDETRVNVGAGFRYNVSDALSLRTELREFHGVGEDTFDTQALLGISLAFHRTVSDSAPTPRQPTDTDNDGVPDNRDQCPGTPAGVSVDNSGCERDADGDGVVNSKDQCPGTTAGATVDETGCEGVTETVKTIKLNVNFPTDSSVIGDRFDSEIQQVADFMRENLENSVEIAGHTDSRGAADYNRALSQRRADAVAARLTGPLGVSADLVNAVGYGEAEPVANNDTAAGRAENRRVEARFQIMR